MLFKHLPIVALAGYAFAQNEAQSLNATLAGNSQLSNLTQLLSMSPQLINQLSSVGNITILAPSNEAFERAAEVSAFQALTDPEFLASVLLYHILEGTIEADDITNTTAFVPTFLTNTSFANVTGGQVVEAVKQGNETSFFSGLLSRSNVTQANVNFTGGIIHVIDSVLLPPVNVLETASALNLTAFRGAVNGTNLTETVTETEDITIFAPNNEAFVNIASALDDLNATTLAGILAHHVVNGTVAYSSTLEDGQNITAADGGNLTITIRDGNVFVNQARVVTPNILIGNGVLHVIDAVLNPANGTEPSDDATTGANAFASATREGDDVPFTSGQPTPSTTVNPTTAAPSNAGGQSGSGSGSGSDNAAGPKATAAVGYGAMLGVAAVWFL